MFKVIFWWNRKYASVILPADTKAERGGNDAICYRPPYSSKGQYCGERTQAFQPARLRQRLNSSDHGRRRTDARRLLQLFQEQERSVHRGIGMFFHGPAMEELLGGS